MKRAIRLLNRLIARICWRDNESLKVARNHTARLIAQHERDLRFAKSQRRIAELQTALRNEKAHLAGLDYAIRANESTATRAAMRAMY